MVDIYLQKVLNGDTEAFRFFVEQYKEMAYKMAISITKEEFSAKDAVQEAFILAYRKLHTFNRKSKFSTWFSRIVINEALKLRRIEHKKETAQIVEEEQTDEASYACFKELEREEQAYFIDLAIKRLDHREALVLNLYYLQEFKVTEISEATGWSAGNVKVILHRARKNMYRALDQILQTEKKEIY